MAADQDADLARPGRRPRDGPGGEPPGLAVVDAHIARPGRRSEPGEQAEGRHAAFPEILDGLADARMVDGDHGDGIRRRADLVELRDRRGRRQLGGESDERAAADARRRAHGALERGGERLVEEVRLLLQHEAERALRRIRIEPLADQGGGMKADLLRRLQHAPRRLLAHGVPPVQHPVDGRHRDAGRPRQVGDGRPAAHRRA